MQLSDSEICRAISESIEPEPRNWTYYEEFHEWRSDSGFWKKVGSPQSSVAAVRPANYFLDPAARDLLVRGMLEQGWVITLVPIRNLNNGVEVFATFARTMGREESQFSVTATYDRIWPLAFLKTIPAGKENI